MSYRLEVLCLCAFSRQNLVTVSRNVAIVVFQYVSLVMLHV